MSRLNTTVIPVPDAGVNSPEALGFSASLDRTEIPARQGPVDLKCHLRVWPSPDLGRGDGPATGTSICLVFDCSTSMSGRKLQAAIDSAKAIVDIIHERHLVSLVAFQTRSRLLVDNARATPATKDGLKRKIDELHLALGGTTNMAAGIAEGMEAIQRGAGTGQVDAKVMVILSDGAANQADAAAKAAVEASKAGIQLFAVGIGARYEGSQLLRLVRPSNGAVFAANDVDETEGVFRRLAGRVDSFVATGARIDLTFAEGVVPGTVSKTSPESAFLGRMEADADRRVQLHVGNLERDKSYAFLLQATVPPGDEGELELARATLRYDVPGLGLKDQVKEVRVLVSYCEDLKAAEPVNGEVVDASLRATIAELSEALPEVCRRGNHKETVGQLQRLVDCCDQVADTAKKGQFESALAEFQANGSIGKGRLNSCLVASAESPAPVSKPPAPATPAGVSLFDVVLVEPGTTPILLIREIRDATGLRLREISELIQGEAKTVSESLPLDDATLLQQRIEGAGARAELRRRGSGGNGERAVSQSIPVDSSAAI